MLSGLRLRGLAIAAHQLVLGRTVILPSVLNFVISLTQVLEPLERSIVVPRVKERNISTNFLFSGNLLGAILVLHIVHRSFTELFESIC
jgi:hypothetical protein